MSDFKSRKIIEALRSGVPSKEVGQYFSEARPKIMQMMKDGVDAAAQQGQSSGIIITGKYGEGKTHLLNSVYGLAESRNMVVSMLPLSKESPFNKQDLIFKKLMENTYLPGREQPGFMHVFDEKMQDSRFASDLILFATSELSHLKILHILKAYLKETDDDEKFKLQADLLGEPVTLSDFKKRYHMLYHENPVYGERYRVLKHSFDYYIFMSYVFQKMGYNGWVILIDEAELIGRLSKTLRAIAYRNIYKLLHSPSLVSTFLVFAFTSTYNEDVIEKKKDFEYLDTVQEEWKNDAVSVLNDIIKAPTLNPLTKEEIHSTIEKIIQIHAKAYDWNPDVPIDQIVRQSEGAGFLLRTKLRTAIELLDQLYQYGKVGKISVGELTTESYEEDVPSLDQLNI